MQIWYIFYQYRKFIIHLGLSVNILMSKSMFKQFKGIF